MAREKTGKRDSRALEPQLITDPHARAEAEARNVLRAIRRRHSGDSKCNRTAFIQTLRPSLILALHRKALSGISIFAGNFRPAGVEIKGSRHEPAGAHLVPELVEELCDYVNENWQQSIADPLSLLCHVEAQLDTSFRGRKWKNIAHCFLHRPVHPCGGHVAGDSCDSRSDCRQSKSILRCFGCGGCRVERRAGGCFENGGITGRAACPPTD